MLKSSTKEFLDLKSPLSLVREMRDNNYNQFSSELWTEMVEMGWTALTIPEKYNGLNFGYVGLGQVLEEMGRKLTSEDAYQMIKDELKELKKCRKQFKKEEC